MIYIIYVQATSYDVPKDNKTIPYIKISKIVQYNKINYILIYLHQLRA